MEIKIKEIMVQIFNVPEPQLILYHHLIQLSPGTH